MERTHEKKMKNGLKYQYMCTENHLFEQTLIGLYKKPRQCPPSSNSFFVFIYLCGLHYHLLFIERHASDLDTKLADFSLCIITHGWCLLGPCKENQPTPVGIWYMPGEAKLHWREYSSFLTHDELQFPGGGMVLKTKQPLRPLKFFKVTWGL